MQDSEYLTRFRTPFSLDSTLNMTSQIESCQLFLVFSSGLRASAPHSKWRSEKPLAKAAKWPPKFLGVLSPKTRSNVIVLFEQRFQIARKQTGLPDARNNPRKSHFIMCQVTKYSTILGVFQQPWPGGSPTAILNEEKALGTRLEQTSILSGT